jgi:hypothetical protein
MPWVSFEPTFPVFQQAKIIHAFDCAATVVGIILTQTETVGGVQNYLRIVFNGKVLLREIYFIIHVACNTMIQALWFLYSVVVLRKQDSDWTYANMNWHEMFTWRLPGGFLHAFIGGRNGRDLPAMISIFLILECKSVHGWNFTAVPLRKRFHCSLK